MNTKERILLAALDLFSRDGYEAVSVSMIAEALDMTKGALYKHYENKREIFDSIIRRMEQQDYENAKRFEVPTDLFEHMPEAYRKTGHEKLAGFTLAQFLYWTGDPFASRFRKMITLEQFRNPEMNALYQQYLGTGPLKYTEDLFREIFSAGHGADPRQLALEFYGPVLALIDMYEASGLKKEAERMLGAHMEGFIRRMAEICVAGKDRPMYPRSEKYSSPELMRMIMGPNPIKLEEELLRNNMIKPGSVVCDLGSGNGLTSVFMAKEYGFKVYAADLWSDPEENRRFFVSQGLLGNRIVPVKADATALPFDKEFFDAVVSVDSYNYFGRDKNYLGDKLLPFVKPGGYIYIAIPGMKKDCHDALPEELLLSWTPEQLDFMHDVDYWRGIIECTDGIEIISVKEMKSNEEVWRDWLMQDNQYAVGDRKSMEAGAGKYLNFIEMIIRKK